jgi:hypothetical protein
VTGAPLLANAEGSVHEALDKFSLSPLLAIFAAATLSGSFITSGTSTTGVCTKLGMLVVVLTAGSPSDVVDKSAVLGGGIGACAADASAPMHPTAIDAAMTAPTAPHL